MGKPAPNYDSIIDQLSEDPEFLNLPEDEQDSLVQELAQDRLGVVPKSENVLGKIAKLSQGATQGFADTFTMGGTALARGAADKMVPLEGEAQEKFNEITETDPIAYGAGAAVPIMKGVTDLGRAGINSLFGKQIAKAKLPEASGKLSNSIQKVFASSQANPSAGAQKADVLKQLQDGLSRAKDQSGPQGRVFRKWIKIISNDPNPVVNPNTLEEMETAFGHVAKFGKDAGANPRLVQSAKETNRFLSGKFDEAAKQLGVPEFIKRSKEKSDLLRQAKSKPGFIGRGIKEILKLGIAGGVGGAVTSKLIDRD